MKKGKKILYFVTEDWYFCSHRMALAKASQKQGYEVIVLSRVNRDAAKIISQGFTLIPIDIQRGGLNFVTELKTLYSVFKVFKQVSPDIVHNIALKPVIYGSGVALFFPRIKIVNLIAGMGAIFSSDSFKARVLKPVVKLFLQFLFKRPSCRVIVQNSLDKNVLVEQLGVDIDKVKLIKGSGIDIEKFCPSPEPNGVIIVALVSRFLWDKGIMEYVEAVKYLKHEKKISFSACLVGEPDSENIASVSGEKLNEWHDAGVINCLGQQDDIAGFWKMAHIAVLPSYREGLPKSLLEAAASGRPIVTTDTAGCNEIVKDGVNGILVPVKDTLVLADAIETLIVNAKLRAKMGAAGRKMVVSEFSDEKIIEQTLQVYRELL